MDIGGTNMRVAAVTGDVLGDVKKIKTPQDPKEGIAQFVALARECVSSEKITAVSGCISGSVSDTGVLSDARNLRAWEGTNIVWELTEALGVSVHVVNDAACAGLGGGYGGGGRAAKPLAYVPVSTGVGGGWIVDGKIAAAGGVAGLKIRGTDL